MELDRNPSPETVTCKLQGKRVWKGSKTVDRHIAKKVDDLGPRSSPTTNLDTESRH